MTIHIDKFGGIAPKLTDRLTKPNVASVAENVDLDRMTLKPFRKPHKVSDAMGDSLLVNDCCHIAGDCNTHFTTYGFGASEIVVGTNVEGFDYPVYTLASHCPPQWKPLGFNCNLPPPRIVVPDSIELDSEGKAFGMEMRSYYYTLVNSMGWESQPSYPSNLERCEVGSPVLVMDINPPAEQEYEKINIYRASNQLDFGVKQEDVVVSQYLLVGTIDNNTAMYRDEVIIAGQACTTEHYTAPPTGLYSIDSWRGGRLVGLNGNTIVMSEKGLPYAFHKKYTVAFDESQAKRVIATERQAYVLTDGKPFVVMLNGDCKEGEKALIINDTLEPLPILSQQSAVAWQGGVIYATIAGLVYLKGESPQILTQDYYSEQQWQELHPHTMKGAIHKGYYYGVTELQTIRFRLPDTIYASDSMTRLTTLSLKPTALCTSSKGRLYMAFDDIRKGVYEWAQGAGYLTMHWQSSVQVEAGITRYSAYKMIAKGDGNIISHYVDTREIQTHIHTQNKPTRLPVGYKGLEWQVDITGVKEVIEYHLAPSIRDLANQ